MRERPIPFNCDMVRAIMAGTKTQTRRTVKRDLANALDPPRGPEDVAAGYPWFEDGDGNWHKAVDCCPFGQPGDRLWVREPGRVVGISQIAEESVHFTVEYLADKAQRGLHLPERFDPQETNVWPSWVKEGHGIPNGIFREAARLILEIVSVRVERVMDITEAGARAEGVELATVGYRDYTPKCGRHEFARARDSFRSLWDALYDAKGTRWALWAANPWVWVVEFKRLAATEVK